MLLAACSPDGGQASAQPAGERIACALSGATAFAADCVVQRVATAAGLQLVVRHPDAGFRRFDVLTDGRGLAAADGAQPAVVTVRGGGIEVAVGADRYRFPATIADAGR